jgi:hypothetical protein
VNVLYGLRKLPQKDHLSRKSKRPHAYAADRSAATLGSAVLGVSGLSPVTECNFRADKVDRSAHRLVVSDEISQGFDSAIAYLLRAYQSLDRQSNDVLPVLIGKPRYFRDREISC